MQTANKPHPKRSRRGLLVGLFVTALLIGSYGLWAARFVHQAQLNRECKSAIEHNQIDRAVALVEAGADPNSYVQEGDPPPIWKLLWDKMSGKSAPPERKVTLFAYITAHWEGSSAADSPDFFIGTDETPLVTTMLRHNANVNAQTNDGTTALYYAAWMGNTAMAQVLLAHGANPNRTEGMLVSPLIAAIDNTHHDIAHLLIANRADLNQKDIFGQTALMHCCSTDANLALVQELLDHHADLNLKDINGYTALNWAYNCGTPKIMAMLRKYGAKE